MVLENELKYDKLMILNKSTIILSIIIIKNYKNVI